MSETKIRLSQVLDNSVKNIIAKFHRNRSSSLSSFSGSDFEDLISRKTRFKLRGPLELFEL